MIRAQHPLGEVLGAVIVQKGVVGALHLLENESDLRLHLGDVRMFRSLGLLDEIVGSSKYLESLFRVAFFFADSAQALEPPRLEHRM